MGRAISNRAKYKPDIRFGHLHPGMFDRSSKKIWGFRVLLLCSSTLLTLLGVEMALRLFFSDKAFHAARQMVEFRDCDKATKDLFTLDDRMGYRPRLGSAVYSEFGTFRNAYPLEKRKGVSRVLFAGDSVTARGRIVAALREVYGDGQYEYWNAGVEGYNTIQEVAYFRLFNRQIQPDHVVLEFHLNDFETTPVAFVDAKGEPVIYAPNCPAREINPYLFQHVRLYRLLVGLTTRKDEAFPRIAGEVKEALEGFRESVKPARFSVMIFPVMKPEAEWDREEKRAYNTIKQILKELAVRSFDLKPWAEAALREGVDIRESPRDTWHPSDAFAKYVAARLKRGGLLEGEGGVENLAGGNTKATLVAGREGTRR